MSKKRSSVGICFIGKRNFPNFIDKYLVEKCGPIIDIDKNMAIGEHKGVHHYTIGQRIKIESLSHMVYFVAKKDPVTQSLYIVSVRL